MDDVEVVWSDAAAEVHRFVVGPIDNNVYVVRCRRTRRGDTDRRGQRARPLAARRDDGSGVTSVLETHGHWDHIGAVEAVREAGHRRLGARRGRPTCCRATTTCSTTTSCTTWATCDCARCTRPATRRAASASRSRTRRCSSPATRLFPGRSGQHHVSTGGDFATIITSIEERVFRGLRRRRPRSGPATGRPRPSAPSDPTSTSGWSAAGRSVSHSRWRR